MDNSHSITKIVCLECGAPITCRSDLVVAGKLFQTFHKACYANPNKFMSKYHKFIGPIPLGWGFLVWMVLLNSFFAVLYISEGNNWIVILFIAISNTVFLSGRIGIYFAIEKKLEDK